MLLAKNDFIELKAGDRVKNNFDESLQWIENGPIEQMYKKQVKDEFLQYQFNRKGDRLNMVLREVSTTTYESILRRIDKFAADIDALAKADFGLKKSETRSIGQLLPS